MKLSDLVDNLSQYDGASDVVIAGAPGGYLDFKIEVRDGVSLDKEGLPIIAIKATKQIEKIHVTVEE
jgi:hypothetical protein